MLVTVVLLSQFHESMVVIKRLLFYSFCPYNCTVKFNELATKCFYGSPLKDNKQTNKKKIKE